MNYSKARSILIIAILLFGGVVFSSVLYPVSAQTAQPTVTPTPNIVLTLQAVIATQQIQIEQLQRDLANEVGDRKFDIRDLLWKWGIAGAVVGAIFTILSKLGIDSITSAKKSMQKAEKDFAKQVKEIEEKWESHIARQEGKWEIQSQKNLNKLLEKYDLANLPIYIPKETGDLRRRLELSDLKHDEYINLSNVITLQGVVVVKFDETMSQKIFRDMVKAHGPNPEKTAFVIFAEPRSVEDDTIKCFENLVIGNFPATVVSNILAVGRGLEIDEIEKEDA